MRPAICWEVFESLKPDFRIILTDFPRGCLQSKEAKGSAQKLRFRQNGAALSLFPSPDSQSLFFNGLVLKFAYQLNGPCEYPG